MNLLIVTQKVDKVDPILGFFHGWIEEFAKHCDHVTVIAQQTGQYTFPKNVTVVSLGKGKGKGTVGQVRTFWKSVLKYHRSYDHVFVHMTPVWVLLGAPIWMVLRKPIYLWYEIKRGSWKLSIALLLVRKVFAASEHGLPSVSKKQVIVGHGIDTKKFVPNADLREKRHLVAVGRITAVKQYDVILRTLVNIPDATLTIAGGTVTTADTQTEYELRELMHRLALSERVSLSWVPPDDVPRLLQRADCMLHASQGGLDKAVLQAMACGCPVVTTSEAAQSVLPKECRATAQDFSEKTQVILALSADHRQSLSTKLRSIVEKDHSLSTCIAQMVSAMRPSDL